ncbi:DNA primase catalytic core [Kribbella antiqua]|uniref:DNA primase catalytic core n=1 Tax=Kribbella antiqua TaxID=2512217 RepID=A0A4R2IC23_9ACTN|nr:toprim domain-containing protein [Kribbella antiqua]TCO41018.1 DNA primase catalytic core [Kribbella antiqua]
MQIQIHRPGDRGCDVSEHAQLIRVHEVAATFYRRELINTPDGWAAQHLRDRKLDGVLAPGSPWRVGYAPDGWSRLVGYLRRQGFDDKVLLDAGLASPTRNGYLIDRFRDRIMFVACDIDLHLVGFVGRARGDRVRYLNTPTTAIYRKSHALVGLDAQRDRLASGAVPVIVEGVPDALAVGQLGANWAGVSVCGTAITRQQAQVVRRHATTDAVIVALDGDFAGKTGAVRSLDALSAVFDQVLVADLPATLDPASVFEKDPDRLLAALSAPRPLVDLAIEMELARWDRVRDHISGQVNAVRAVAPLVSRLPANRVASEIARLSRALRLDSDIVSREVLAAVGLRTEQRQVRRRASRSADAADAAADPDCSWSP